MEMFRFHNIGRYAPTCIGIFPVKKFLEISNDHKFWWEWVGKCKGPVRELLTRSSSYKLVLLSNNQFGNSPVKLLWERSTWNKSCWWKRNLGNVRPFPQQDKESEFNWNFGVIEKCDSAVSAYIWLLSPSKDLSLEWLKKGSSEIGIWKWSSERSKYWMDVRALRGEMFPENMAGHCRGWSRWNSWTRHG